MTHTYSYSNVGLALTKGFEGLRLKAYQDGAGVWTIGYGHTRGVRAGMTCTQEQADTWLHEDVADAVHAVNTLVHVPISRNKFDALVDFTFNVGVKEFAASTLLRLVNSGDNAKAAAEFGRWVYAGGKVSPGLARRRTSEAELFKLFDR